MKNSPIVLLPAADKRPAKEAREWFGDGFRLLKMRLAQWTSYSALAMLALLFASLAGQSLVNAGGEGALFATLTFKLLLVNAVMVMVQTGMYRSMTRVVCEGGNVRVDDMLWLLSAPQRKALWQFVLLLVGCNLVFILLEHRMFADQAIVVEHPQGEYVLGDVRVNVNMDALWRYGALWTLHSLLMWVLTWAVLPLLTMFAHVTLGGALRYALDGTLKNLPGLLLLGVWVFLVFMGIGMAAVLLDNSVPVLVVPVVIVCLVWLLPLGNIWSYSAYRHVFTDW